MQTDATARRRAKWLGGLVAIAVGLLSFFVADDEALLDWDTYQRIQFIESYDPHGADTHVLYHWLLRGIVSLGVPPLTAIFALTSFFLGLLVLVADQVAAARGLSDRGRAAALVWLIFASPGLVALVAMAEDNVAYLPPLLIFLHFATAAPANPSEERWYMIGAGAALATAMHLNITALVFLAVGPLGIAALALGERGRGKRWLGTVAAALGVYYAMGTLWPSTPIALHPYLAQAVTLRDFGPEPAPLWSMERLQQYLGGGRAMLLTPATYRMELPPHLRTLLETLLPIVVLAGYLVPTWATRRQTHEGWRWSLAACSVAWVFPFLYEPSLLERWDMAWLTLLLLFLELLRRRPRAGLEVLLGFAVLAQAFGTVIFARYHYGGDYLTSEETQLRDLVSQLETTDADPIVLPLNYDRLHLAHLAHHLPGRRFFLIGDVNRRLECRTLRYPLRELPIPCRSLQGAGGPNAYVHLDARDAVSRLDPPP